MSDPARHLENGSVSPTENGVDRLAAADAAKAEANAHFKGLHMCNPLLNACALSWAPGNLNLAACLILCFRSLSCTHSFVSGSSQIFFVCRASIHGSSRGLHKGN